MPSYRAHTDIATPPADVRTLVVDVTRHPEWTDDPLEVEQVRAGEYRTSAVSRGRTITATVEVIETTPELVILDVRDPTGAWRHTFTITPTARGCRVEREISGDLSIPQALLYWLVLLPIKQPSNRRSLQRLRTLAEDG